MTIHHDKLAYGKLAPNMEEMKEDDVLKMLQLLNEQCEEVEEQPSENKNVEKNNIKKL